MKPIAAISFAVLCLLFVLMLYFSSDHYQAKKPPRYQPAIPMTFDHQSHNEQQCIDCHHNFVDGSGSGLCLDCHLTTDPIKLEFEQQFHQLCRGCHEEKQMAEEKHGPIRSCVACHTADELP